ncbi:MAG: sulfatase-like hydrolase/transferase [Rikenellaceae bacterium]
MNKTATLLSTSLALMAVNQTEAKSKQSDKRPNLLVVLCDDVNFDMFGCYGNTQTVTPNIDRLAEQGVTFRTGWNSALSGPARAQIMTGCYATTTDCWSNGFFIPDQVNKKGLFERFVPFSKHLHDAGYTTAVGGKWHVGSGEHPSNPIVGFDHYALWEGNKELNALGLPNWDGGMESVEEGKSARYWHPCIIMDHKHRPTTESDFGPDIICKYMCDFIADASKDDAPFLAYYPMLMPHGPYVDTPLQTDKGVNIDIDSHSKYTNDERFVNMINYIDILMGRLLDQLEKSGVLENTLIIFTADNGTAVTAKSRGVERGCHVPYIFSGYGVKKRDGLTAEICDGTDIYPTLLDFAGIELPKIDGVSMKPFLNGKSDTHREYIHSCIGGTQLLRTRTHLLEVVTPILGLPEGRFYYCGDNAAGNNYIRAEGVKEHEETLEIFRKLLDEKYIGLKADNPYFEDKRGKAFLRLYIKGKDKHIYNHRDYVRYDESIGD